MSNGSLELGGDNWAAKDGNLLGYAVGDSSGKYVPREFTFARGSNLAATRVAANGLIEKGRENLLLQSNQFDTTWGTPNTDVTPNQSGYDGSNDAWLLEADAVSSNANLNQSASISGVNTASIYAKEGTTNWFRFSVNDSGINSRAWFDLSGSGAVGTSAGNIIDTKIEGVGNGYFRCSITFNATAANLYIFIANADGSISYSVGDNIYIQDAQLEAGMVATDYTETGATTVQAGLLEDEPRIDYTGGTGSLLLEPSRTNSVEYSEGILSLSGSATAEYDFTQESPTGLRDGVALISNLQGSEGDRIQYQGDIIGGNTYTGSMYIKGTSGRSIKYYIKRQGGNYAASATQIITFDGTWQRIHSTFTSLADNTRARIVLNNDGNVNADSCYIWGAQVEEGSYPTSYIPNHSGGSVTRSADVVTKEYSDNFNDITIFAEVNSESVVRDSSAQSIQIGNDFSQGGAFFLRRSSNTLPKRLVAFFLNNDNTSVFSSYELPENNSKVAFKYNSTSNACKLFVNGSEVRSATATDITEFDSFRLNGSGGKFNSKQLVVFNTELSDADCITLTTL